MEPSDRTQERLSRLLDRLVGRRGVHHAIVAVERRDGSFHWIGAAGQATAEGAPMRHDTPVFVASVDKLYTATIVLKLCEGGLVDLDGPLTDYLPTTLVGGLHRWHGVDRTHQITVRHLLSHTTGLPDWLEDAPKGDESLVEHLLRQGDRAVTMDELVQSVRERLTPHFPPQPVEARRSQVRYSDTNFMLLVAIIEAVTGQPLRCAYDTFLIHPLGLRHTWIAGHSRPLDPCSEPATLWAEAQPLGLPRFFRSIWAIYSTVGDMLTFLRGLTTGRVFERPETYGLMQQRWHRFGLPRDKAAWRLPQWPIEYGLGVMRFRLPRWLTPLSPVPGLLGHTGSTGSWLFHCPERDLLLSGTVDQVTAGALPFRLLPRLLRALPPAGGDVGG